MGCSQNSLREVTQPLVKARLDRAANEGAPRLDREEGHVALGDNAIE